MSRHGVVKSVRQTERAGGVVRSVDELDLSMKGRDPALPVFTGGKQADRRIPVVGQKTWLHSLTTRPAPISPQQRMMSLAARFEVARFRAADEDDASARADEEEQCGNDIVRAGHATPQARTT